MYRVPSRAREHDLPVRMRPQAHRREVAEKLDYTPGVFSGERHVRDKWVCSHCETLVQAPVALHIIDKAIPTTGLLAHVLIAKFVDHLVLYRQETIFAMPDDRRRLQNEQAEPIAKKFMDWLETQRSRVPDGSATAKAIDYNRGRWIALTRYFDGARPDCGLGLRLGGIRLRCGRSGCSADGGRAGARSKYARRASEVISCTHTIAGSVHQAGDCFTGLVARETPLDKNSRALAGRRFSRPLQSTTLPRFLESRPRL